MSTTTIFDLFRRYHLAMYRYFRRMTGRPDLAEDLTQDLYLRVLKGIRHYHEQDRERAWVFRIARNLLLDHWKAQSRKPSHVNSAHGFAPSRPATQFLGLSLEQSLNELPRTEREAFVLCEVGGLTYDEIANVTATSVNSVRSSIYRARRCLRANLAEELRTSRHAGLREKTS